MRSIEKVSGMEKSLKILEMVPAAKFCYGYCSKRELSQEISLEQISGMDKSSEIQKMVPKPNICYD